MSTSEAATSLDLSAEGFLYYGLIVAATLYIIAYGIDFILKKASSLEYDDRSLISRRIAAISIYLVTLLIFGQAFYVLYQTNRFFNSGLPKANSFEFWEHNRIPKNFESDLQKLYFYATKTDVTYEGYKQSKLLIQIAITINAAFNGIDAFGMYMHGRGFSAEFSSLLLFHHWTIIWVESCIFNLELLNIHPDWNWMFVIIGIILIIGCIGDLILSPSTLKPFVSEKNKVYRKLLWFHLLFSVLLFRGAGVSLIAFDFIVALWQMDWKYGASFQIAMIFMWLQWNNLGKAIFKKISNW